MNEKVSKVGEYTVKEIFCNEGKDIKKVLQEAFKAYCISILQNK